MMANYNSRYETELPANIGPFKELLEKYSQIPPDEVEAHIHKIRDKAWAATPYPCFGLWGFTRISSFTEDLSYQLAISRLTTTGPDAREDKLLDMGCGIGQNVRQLAHAGVAASRLLASDLHGDLLDLGFEMFQDREKMKDATFLAGDVFNEDGLRGLEGKVAIIHAANFFHLFPREKQVAAGARMVRFLRPDAKNAFIFGRQIGSLEAGERETASSSRPTGFFLHDQASFQALWDDIGKVTETKWKVEMEMLGNVPEGFAYLGEGARYTRFVPDPLCADNFVLDKIRFAGGTTSGLAAAIPITLNMTEHHHFVYKFPSPLEGYENAPPLPTEKSEDGKSLKNPETGVLSKAYESFIDPLDKGRRGGFDVHIYYMQSQMEYARQLHDRIRREFPELRIYNFFDKPVGPHPYAMFEVSLFTPAQFGAFVPWLVIWRGPLSALIHPNTTEEGYEADVELRNHTQRATWMGENVPLDVSLFIEWGRRQREEDKQKAAGQNGS